MRWAVGRRVTVLKGPGYGHGGTIVQRAHSDVQPIINWVVRLDEPVVLNRWAHFELGYADADLGPYVVPKSARPRLVGALAGGRR